MIILEQVYSRIVKVWRFPVYPLHPQAQPPNY